MQRNSIKQKENRAHFFFSSNNQNSFQVFFRQGRKCINSIHIFFQFPWKQNLPLENCKHSSRHTHKTETAQLISELFSPSQETDFLRHGLTFHVTLAKSCTLAPEALHSIPWAKIMTRPGSSSMSSFMCRLSHAMTTTACFPGTRLQM